MLSSTEIRPEIEITGLDQPRIVPLGSRPTVGLAAGFLDTLLSPSLYAPALAE